jgi:hypothetical protein
MSDVDCVVLVHGTWTDTPGWHKFDSARPNNFAARLADLLQERGITDAVERKFGDRTSHFSWSGKNDHRERLDAASRLAEHFSQLGELDPNIRIHVVAHSHGCNVVLKAVQLYLEQVADEANQFISSLVDQRMRGETDFDKAIKHSSWFQNHQHIFQNQPELLDALKQQFEALDTPPVAASRRPELLVRGRGNFIGLWVDSSKRVRLGKLVFLGPPFLTKLWAKRSALLNFLISAIDFVLAASIAGTVVYALSMVVWSFIWLIVLPFAKFFDFELLRSPTLNVFDWNGWLLTISCTIAAIAGLVSGLIAGNTSERLNANFYFDERSLALRYFLGRRKRQKGSRVFPLSCLTITAEWLDEVILGFSSEPIVYGALLPQLQNMMKPNFSMRLPPIPIGHKPGMAENLNRRIYVVRRLLSSSFKWIAAPGYRFWQRRMTRNLVRLISSAAFGIPLYEARNAIIRVSNAVRLPHIFHERIWDVTKHLTGGASYFESEQERDARYSFLWNGLELDIRKKNSILWRQIKNYRPHIEAHYEAYGVEANSFDTLAKACVVVEERTKEAIGAVGLTHLAYHSDLSICRAVADFIATDAVPHQARGRNRSVPRGA